MGRTIVVTGCSSGLGADFCIQLAALYPEDVIYATMRNLTDERKKHVADGAKEAVAANRIRFLDIDVSSEQSTFDGMKAIVEATGKIDVVVANAGYGALGFLEAIPESAARDMFEVNYWGALRTVRAAMPSMIKGGGGLVMVISSIAAIRGYPLGVHYAATKAALEAAVESEAALYATRNVKYTLIEPGPVDTAFMANTSKAETIPPTCSDPQWLSAATDHAVNRLKERFVASQQTSPEVAAVMVDVVKGWVEGQDVPLRVQTSDKVRDLVKLKVSDVDGSVVQSKLCAPVWEGFKQ